jgi:5,10-methylenetetrahydromethanopterin reductase
MRFGFLLFTRDLQAVGPVARLGEAQGFELIGVVDSPSLAYDTYVALTLAALSTDRARLGPAVTNPRMRHPLILANLAASLERLAPGRSFLGLGTGWSAVRHAGTGQATLADLADTVRLVRELLAGRRVAIGGAETSLRVGGRPVPVLLAGSGPRTLRLAGETADLVMFNLGAVPEAVADALGWIREGAESAGRDPGSVERWLYIPAAVAPDRARALDEVRAAAVSSGAFVMRGDLAAKRVPPAVRDKLEQLRRGYRFGEHLSPGRGANYELAERLGLTDYLLERFSIAGTPDDCRRQIERLRVAGVENICFNVSTAPDLPACLELFGREVLPAFAAGR